LAGKESRGAGQRGPGKQRKREREKKRVSWEGERKSRGKIKTFPNVWD